MSTDIYIMSRSKRKRNKKVKIKKTYYTQKEIKDLIKRGKFKAWDRVYDSAEEDFSYDFDDIIEVIKSLKKSEHHEIITPCDYKGAKALDVYHPKRDNKFIYLKFCVCKNYLIIMSFKKWDMKYEMF